jgi:hypothetical protein
MKTLLLTSILLFATATAAAGSQSNPVHPKRVSPTATDQTQSVWRYAGPDAYRESNLCFTMRSYVFKRWNEREHYMGMTTCTPAQRFDERKAVRPHRPLVEGPQLMYVQEKAN